MRSQYVVIPDAHPNTFNSENPLFILLCTLMAEILTKLVAVLASSNTISSHALRLLRVKSTELSLENSNEISLNLSFPPRCKNITFVRRLKLLRFNFIQAPSPSPLVAQSVPSFPSNALSQIYPPLYCDDAVQLAIVSSSATLQTMSYK